MGTAAHSLVWPAFETLERWTDVHEAFDSFPEPAYESRGGYPEARDIWVFRGHKDSNYDLEPSIERLGGDWWARELMALEEFRSKASLHMNASLLPEGEEKLDWLALLQHFGVPTRLLDFTYSPYVALYFALRHRSRCERPAAVWAIRLGAIRDQARLVTLDADKAEKGCEDSVRYVSNELEDFISGWDSRRREHEFWRDACAKALAPSGARREHYKRCGFAMAALPSVQNTRLSSQQGVFLLNGAEHLNFRDSLRIMMKDSDPGHWCRRFILQAPITQEVEDRLFRMNIHDLSLFPDPEGLAGFVRQKLRLYWKV